MKFSPQGKILILRYTRLSRTPTAQYSAEILTKAGFDILAFEYGLPSEASLQVDGTIPRLRFPWPKPPLPASLQASFGLTRTFLHLYFLCRRERPKALLAHGLQESILAFLLGKSLRIPYVVHIHEVYEKKNERGLNRLLLALEGPALRSAAFTICSEAKRADIYTQWHKLRQRPLIAFNCPPLRTSRDKKDRRAQWGIPAGQKVLLYIGGMERKNLILEAVEAVAGVEDLSLVLVGWCDDAFRAELMRTVEELGVASRVKLVGEVEDKWEALEASDLSWCFYRPDELRTRHLATASNKLMEALAAGLAVVAGPNPDFEEFLARYPVGITTAGYDVLSIRATLAKLVQDSAALARFHEAGLAAHRTELNYEHQYESALAKWKDLISRTS